MKQYAESNSDGKGLTLAELRTFIRNVDAMELPEHTRIRVRAKFGNDRGAKVRVIIADERDAGSTA